MPEIRSCMEVEVGEPCVHKRIVLDKFSRLHGVRRTPLGNCYCLDCSQPIAADWNNGRPLAGVFRKE